MSLADRMNGVPDREGYYYGLAQRRDAWLDVSVIDGATQEVIGMVHGHGWAGTDEHPGVHALAQKLVDDWNDRTVHAVTYQGVEVVRYDRAGKWFLEWPDGQMIPAKHIGVEEAARTAVEHSGDIRFRLPGGRAFDRRVRKLRGF